MPPSPTLAASVRVVISAPHIGQVKVSMRRRYRRG
jgi:hypothetical protein